MSLTEEESNFLRFCFLNLKVASEAARVYFDSIHPPAELDRELKSNYVKLKGLRFMTKLQLDILYPNAVSNVTSADFDTTLIVCLLRNMPPRESAPVTGWDNLPHSGDTSTCADLARIKWYRNMVVHCEDGKLSSTDFSQFWGDLEGAIGRIGGASLLKDAQSAKHIVLDRSLTNILNELQNFEKDVHNVLITQVKHTNTISSLNTEIENQRTLKERHENKLQELNDSLKKGDTDVQRLNTELSDHKRSIQKCTEAIEECNKEKDKLERSIEAIQEKTKNSQNQIEDQKRQLNQLECKYDRQIQEIDEKLLKHDEQLAKIKQYDMDKTLGGSNQRRLEEDTRALIDEDVKEDTFVSTKAVTDGLLLLKQNGVLLITGYAGTGKSRIGRHVLHKFCTENKSLKFMKLTLADWDNMTNKKEKKDNGAKNVDNSEENMDNSVDNFVLLLDDIFGETYCIFNREKDTSILDKIYAYVCKGNIKVIITIRDTVKRQCQELFDSHRLFKFDFVDLSSNNYVLSYEEKHSILMKYMKIVRQSDFSYSKGFSDCNGGTVLDKLEILKIIKENPVKGFPLVVYQFVHNDKYFHLRSTFFDRPTEAMLEEMNEIRRKGLDNKKFMIQYAVMVYTAINGNCLKLDDSSNIAALQKIIDAIYGQPIKIIKCNILDAIKELKGSYLINIPNQRLYRFHHQTLQESVIISFAQVDEENIKKIIPLISFSFFLKMVKPKSYKEKDEEVVLMIPTDSFKVLADRLADIYIAEFSVNHSDTFFLYNLCNTEIFQQEYDNLLPFLVEALEKEDNKDIYTENMIRSVVMDTFDYVRSNVHIKNTDLFFAYLLDTVAKLESQLDVYHFVLKIFKKMINTSSSRMSVDYTKFALISSLYVICATKDVRCVKATLDMIEEHKIPVLVDQGVILTEVPNITSMSNFGEEYDDETCVFLTLCIWNAYKVCNIPVLEFLLSKYNHTPFDINLFFKMIYRADWTHNMIPSVRKRVLGRPTLSFEPLKWMIETFPDQELEDPNFILRAACKYQMFDTVEYLASGTRPISRISCLKAFLNKPESLVGIVPFSQELFSFLIKQIDMSSEGLIPFVSSVTQKLDIPDYMFEAFLPVCINNANIFRLACENGQFYLVKLIIESRQIEHLDIQSALVAACTESESTQHHSSNHEKADDEVAKLEIVKYIVDNIGFDQFDFIAICQQAYSSKKIKILEWFVQNIDTTKLDVYTIIDSALICNRSDILKCQMQNIGLESLDKKRILKSVNKLIIDTRIETEHFTAEYHTTILNVLHTLWYSAEVKEALLMEEIVKTAYARKYFKLLMWIHENCRPHISIDSKHVLMSACVDCRVDLAKWVLQNFEQTSLKDDGAKLLMLACKKIRYSKNIMRKDDHLSNDIKEEYWKKVGNKLKSTVTWILETFEILPLDIISFVKELINVNEKIRNELSNLMASLFEKYQSCLKKEDITKIINESLEQKCYVLVNWFLEKCGSLSFFKQMVLEKACADNAIETIKILSNYFYTLNLNQAMIKACTSTYSIFGEFLHKEEDYDKDQSVACLNLLWNEINKIGHDSIDIRTIVSLVCREKKVRNNVMTWILLKFPLDQSLINEVLITCCQQGKIHHVKYIVHEVNNENLDIEKAFVMACREFPMFQREHFKSLGGFGLDLHKIKYDGPSYLMIVDYLFQITNDKDSYLSLVVSELFEKTKFELILYFLREGYCRNTNMKNLLKEACISGYVRLMQWILGNVEHKELDIRSAFLEACVCRQQTCINLRNKIVNHVTCLALMWHYIHDINMFEIDTVLKTITDSQSFTSDDEFKTWLLYMKSIKQRICKSNSALLNTE